MPFLATLLLAIAPLETPDPRTVAPTARWLAGTWLLSATPDDRARIACVSGTTYRYDADGTTRSFETRGRWRLRGDRLGELTTQVFATADPADFPRPWRWSWSRIVRIGPDEGVLIVGPERIPMLRCRPGDLR